MAKKKYLKMHKYKIWQNRNGDWLTYFPDAKRGRLLKKRKSREDLENDICELYKETEENPYIFELFNEWNERRLELGHIAQSTYDKNIRIFNRHYSELGNRRIKNVSKREFVEFLEEQIAEHNLDSKAFGNLKGITRGFLKRALIRDVINYSAEDVFNRLDIGRNTFKHKIREDYEEVFDEDEMATLLDYIEAHPEPANLVIALLFMSGARIGEAVTIKNEDLGDFTVNIRRTETRYKSDLGHSIYDVKTNPKTMAGVRVVPIPEHYLWILESMKKLNPSGEYVFLNTKGQRMTGNTVRTRLKTLCKNLGIYNKSPHKIRKTYGTILLDNHLDRRLIQDLMGHTDVLTTETHYHRNRKTLERKHEILSNLPDFR
ncbi:MAG: phage integrase family protein [Lachnospiraceae bacterium]|nr:phage integrase family protein [Lachnospiraceae bacterium]